MAYFYNYPINFNVGFTGYQPRFSAYPTTIIPSNDKFVTNPLTQDLGISAETLTKEAQSNPRICEIMSNYNLPVYFDKSELERLQPHLQNTRIAAAQIYSSLPQELKKEVNLPNLQHAALLHDYGKALIPSRILNKSTALTPQEREIIEQHAELSYELLKTQNLNDETLNLIKYHHQTPFNNGYPENNNNFEYGLSSQILHVADEYTALREKRSYKPELSTNEALNIIQQEVINGNISQEVFNALKKGVTQ